MSKVEIVEARADWADAFREIGADLRASLGDRALRIDHIGSTSVPGLASKDVIDVQVTVASLEPAGPIVAGIGYEHRPLFTRDHVPPSGPADPREWAKLYFTDGRRVHVHVRADGRANQRYALLFRDYLRTHPRAAAAYEAFKRALASTGIASAAYADLKDPVCDMIMVAADDWAEVHGWRAGPSDA